MVRSSGVWCKDQDCLGLEAQLTPCRLGGAGNSLGLGWEMLLADPLSDER